MSNLIVQHGIHNQCVDLVLSCVDNYAARLTINSLCCKLNMPWMESGVSEDAFSGHIQLMLPGRTACFQCLPPIAVASGIDEKTIRRNGVCAASLPTTMSIIAGFLVQNTLKYLLHFGQVSYYQSYSALLNHFSDDILLPCSDCLNEDCKKRQNEFKGKWVPDKWIPKQIASESFDDEWGVAYPLIFLLIIFLISNLEGSGEEADCIASTPPTTNSLGDPSKLSLEELMDHLNHM